MTDEKKKEFTLRITQANRSRLLIILYEMTESYIDDAVYALSDGDETGFKESICSVRGCVNELMNTLDYRYSPSMQLLELYVYISRNLITADIHKDGNVLDEIKDIIVKLHGAYSEAAKADTSSSLVDHAQQVYAGLTYGKKDLNENVVTSGTGCEFNA